MQAGKPLSAVAARKAREAALIASQSDTPQQIQQQQPAEPVPISFDEPAQDQDHRGDLNTRQRRRTKRRKLGGRDEDTTPKTFGNTGPNVGDQNPMQDTGQEQGVLMSGVDLSHTTQAISSSRPSEDQDSDTSDYSVADFEPVDLSQPLSRPLSRILDLSRIVERSDGSTQATLEDDEFLTVIGIYDLCVLKGAVEFSGAILRAGSQIHRVCAAATHALPVIAHTKSPYGPENQPAEVILHSCLSGLRELRRLNPKFSKTLDENERIGRTFSIPHHTNEDQLRRPLIPLELPKEWQSLILAISNRETTPPVVLITGPKGTGKSTIGKHLLNSFLCRKASGSGVALLDLDPGQPEYSLPGEVSLHHIKSFNLSPPFAHPMVPSPTMAKITNSCLRSHFIGNASPQDDVQHYLECIRDLYANYSRRLRGQGIPLIINSCGWIQGAGLDILECVAKEFAPSDILYMSTKGPVEVIQVLQSSLDKKVTELHLLPSQELRPSMRTSADLRLMQTMSYFHSDFLEGDKLHWDATPLYLTPSKTLNLQGPEQSIVGVMVLGNEKSPDDVEHVIQGCTLALVAIEGRDALPPSVHRTIELMSQQSHELGSSIDGDIDEEVGSIDDDFFAKIEGQDIAMHNLTAKRKTKRTPCLVRSKTGIPYLFYGHQVNVPLDPSKTRNIGRVLVRSIGENGELKVSSPISDLTIDNLRSQGTLLVLVKGSIEGHRWSYVEEWYEAKANHRDHEQWKKVCERNVDAEQDKWSSDDFDAEAFERNSLWVAVARDRSTKSTGEKAWRARRNMATGDGRRSAA